MTPAQQRLSDLWDEHVRHEFVTRDVAATLATMVPDAYVNHVPVMTGGSGHEALGAFYAADFIPQMPPDTEIVPGLAHDRRRSARRRDDLPLHPHDRDGVDAARRRPHREARRGSRSS
jgi:hypothetical protein